MSMKVQEKFIGIFENVDDWNIWRATTLSKEKRLKGDYYFAHIVRNFGENDEADSYDIGDRSKDFAWLGRVEKYVGKRAYQNDPDLPNYSKRVYQEAVTEEVEIIGRDGKKKMVTDLIKGRLIYEFKIHVNDKNTNLVKKLVGLVGLNQRTNFQVISGNGRPIETDEKTFFSKSVDEITHAHMEEFKQIAKRKK